MKDAMFIFLLTVAVSAIKLGQGFDFDLNRIFTQQNRRVIFKGVIVSVFLVPILFLLLILFFQPIVPLAGTLIIMAVCPAADLSIQQVERLGGDVPVSAGIQAISALISIVTIPLFLKLFEFIMKIHVVVKFPHLIREVAVAQFIPMTLGILCRKIFKNYAWLAKLIIKVATVLLVTCFIIIFIRHVRSFAEFRWQDYVTIILAVILAFTLGVVFSGKNFKRQISLAIETSLRTPGLAYLIASETFSLERVDTAIVPYVFTTVVVVVLCTLLLKQVQKLVSQ